MATDERSMNSINIERAPSVEQADGREDANLGELFRELAQETTSLVRQEVTLAKLELKETASHAAADVGKLAAAAVLAVLGIMALTTFLIALLGTLLGGAYWAGALIVGLLYLTIAAVVGIQAKNDLQQMNAKPERTIQTLKDDKAWAENEARDVRQDLRG